MTKQEKERAVLPPLCQEQEEAAEHILKSDRRVTILTGCAGSGKSVLIKTLVDRHPDLFTLTSTTARSALHIGGVTVDRLFSINRSTWAFRSYEKMEANLRGAGQFIVIDEASMVGWKMAKLINNAIDFCKKQVILCGDWAQASPVKDRWPMGHTLLKGADFIFLKECHRQADQEFLDALNDIRVGEVTERAEKFFSSRVVKEDNDEKDVVKMYATNQRVNDYNAYRLRKHAKDKNRPTFTVEGSVQDERGEYAQTAYPLDDHAREKMLDMSAISHKEPLALGCRVIITYNIPNRNYHGGNNIYEAVNGDTGVLQCFDDGEHFKTMNVQLDRTGKTVRICPVEIEVYGYSSGKADYILRGFPIRLGYAITIHKSQGMTLEKVEVDMKSITFHREESRHGLAYVAFSRARTPEGLALLNWVPRAVYSDPDMKKLIQATGSGTVPALEVEAVADMSDGNLTEERGHAGPTEADLAWANGEVALCDNEPPDGGQRPEREQSEQRVPVSVQDDAWLDYGGGEE